VPITERYSPDFLASCVVVEEENVPLIGYIYEDGVFVEPPQTEPTIVVGETTVAKTEFEQLKEVVEALVIASLGV